MTWKHKFQSGVFWCLCGVLRKSDWSHSQMMTKSKNKTYRSASRGVFFWGYVFLGIATFCAVFESILLWFLLSGFLSCFLFLIGILCAVMCLFIFFVGVVGGKSLVAPYPVFFLGNIDFLGTLDYHTENREVQCSLEKRTQNLTTGLRHWIPSSSDESFAGKPGRTR